MSYFPQLQNGILTQLPFTASKRFKTYKSDMPTGRRHAYAQFSTPLSQWILNFTAISDAEVATAETFFNAMAGRFGQFTLLDPGGNLVQFSENYADASWVNSLVAVGGATTDPFGGAHATSLTASAANPSVSTSVLPDGAAAGIVVCASAWVWAPTGFDISIGFSDSVAGNQGSAVYAVGPSWRRIQFQLLISTAGVISMYLKGWPSGQSIALFGVQVAPLPGAGAYTKTPGNFGLHRKCYFATDQFKLKYKAYNDNSVSLPVEETF